MMFLEVLPGLFSSVYEGIIWDHEESYSVHPVLLLITPGRPGDMAACSNRHCELMYILTFCG